jgi:type IV pilus assembly protein PilC
MPTYVYRGKHLVSNAVVSGERFAHSKQALMTMLRNEQVNPLSIKEKGKEITLPTIKKRVSDKDIAMFTRQFAVMIDSGLPLVQCLRILAMQQEKASFQQILLQVQRDVESGLSLSDSMAKHPKVFDSLYVNMVQAGEAGGILDTILKRLSAYMEKIVKLKSSIKSALIYPAVVISVALIAVFLLLWLVIPTFASLFEGLGAELPLLTRLVIGTSHFIARFAFLIIILVAIIMYSIKKWYDTPAGRRFIDQLLLKIPIIGVLLQKIAIARFTKTLSTLISSGIPILEGLDITSRAAGNVIYEETIKKIQKEVEAGKNMTTPMEDSGKFPTMVIQMVNVGEQTGELDSMMDRVATFYEDEVDRSVANLMSLLEPLLLVFLGCTIGTIVVSMYLPMFTLIGKLAGHH